MWRQVQWYVFDNGRELSSTSAKMTVFRVRQPLPSSANKMLRTNLAHQNGLESPPDHDAPLLQQWMIVCSGRTVVLPSANSSESVHWRLAPVLCPKFSAKVSGGWRSRHMFARVLPVANAAQDFLEHCLVGILPTILARRPFSDPARVLSTKTKTSSSYLSRVVPEDIHSSTQSVLARSASFWNQCCQWCFTDAVGLEKEWVMVELIVFVSMRSRVQCCRDSWMWCKVQWQGFRR